MSLNRTLYNYYLIETFHNDPIHNTPKIVGYTDSEDEILESLEFWTEIYRSKKMKVDLQIVQEIRYMKLPG